MKLIRSSDRSSAPEGATALAIGNFDGLHLGHQALIDRVLELSPKLSPSLMCFEPLPATYFSPEDPVDRLHSVRDRFVVSRALGIERLYMLRFNKRFSSLTAPEFVEQIVVGLARAKHVVVGSDFRFGAKAAGHADHLAGLGALHGFEVSVIDPVLLANQRVSSSLIRSMLAAGQLEEACKMLGRPYVLHGRVLRGQQLGRKLGYPTVNLRPPMPPAVHGILAARVHGPDLDGHPAVVSVGRRPTVAGQHVLLEAHLFGYEGDLYGQHLGVELVQYLRGEVKFDTLIAMKKQMDTDAAQARQILGV